VPRRWRSYFCQDELEDVEAFLANETAQGRRWQPGSDRIFLPLAKTQPSEFSVCIIGQDPYPKAGEPTGLPFSVDPVTDVDHLPDSLKIIFWELVSDLRDVTPPQACPPSGDLGPWTQFCLLWNAAPTAQIGIPGSHLRAWRAVTRRLLNEIASRQRVVFVCWGSKARGLLPPLTPGRHYLIFSSLPSPRSAYSGPHRFVGSRPFTRASEAVSALGLNPAPTWRL
jgi:uracil-DNA glycosylase